MIVALHGFLGLPADWDFLREAGFAIATPSLNAIPPSGDTILGYSLGGRLALRALLTGARYQRAIIVSAGLGIVEESERQARRNADQRWAGRFESEPWPQLMRAWNAQPLFGGHAPERNERDFRREELARQIREWSPAVLTPVAARLAEIEIPVLWIAGERDRRYVAEGEKAVALMPRATLWICPGAAHRVPWEQPAPFVARVRRFLQIETAHPAP